MLWPRVSRGIDVVDGSEDSSVLVTASVALSGPGWHLRTKMSVPNGPMQLSDLLPLARSFADAVMSAAISMVEDQGKRISCQKGCGVCCRQLVAIPEIEARHIGHLVNEFPDPLRARVRARFADARHRLDEAGLLEKLLHPDQWNEGEGNSLGLTYFRLAIPCPFLEGDACSIYAVRPLACREYLVTSPAERCAEPTPETVERVEPPLKMWTALARLDKTAPAARFIRWVPLVMAPEWFEAHPQEPPPRPGPELLREWFDHMVGRDGPPGTPANATSAGASGCPSAPDVAPHNLRESLQE